MLSILVALALAASPPTRGPVLLVSPGLRAPTAQATAANFFSNALARELEDAGVQVATRDRITEKLGPDRQAALLSCELTAPACLEALGSTLGADAVLVGELQHSKQGYSVRVQVRATRDGALLSEEHAAGFGSSDLNLQLRTLARKVGYVLSRRLGAPLEAKTSVRLRAFIPAAGALGLASAGALFLGSANAKHDRLVHPTSATDPTPAEAVALQRSGKRQQLLGGALVGAGLAAGGYAAYLFLRNEDRRPGTALALSVAPTPGGLVLTGVFP